MKVGAVFYTARYAAKMTDAPRRLASATTTNQQLFANAATEAIPNSPARQTVKQTKWLRGI